MSDPCICDPFRNQRDPYLGPDWFDNPACPVHGDNDDDQDDEEDPE